MEYVLEVHDSKGDIVTNCFHFALGDLINIGEWLRKVPELDADSWTIFNSEGRKIFDSYEMDKP